MLPTECFAVRTPCHQELCPIHSSFPDAIPAEIDPARPKELRTFHQQKNRRTYSEALQHSDTRYCLLASAAGAVPPLRVNPLLLSSKAKIDRRRPRAWPRGEEFRQ